MEDVDDADWVPFGDRPEWKDVRPVYHNDTEDAAVSIAYSERFATTFAYFRGVIQSDERSERAFNLTTEAVWQNPANYTVWQFRRVLLESLNKNLKAELDFCDTIIEDNPKNYQVWHHRKLVVEKFGDASRELTFTADIFADDAKNYHAWQHRHWVVQKFNLWDSELDYSSRLLADDVRNNSAWNYRYFVISNTSGFTAEVIERELGVTMKLIEKTPHNESAWNYLSGILIETGWCKRPDVWQFCEQLHDKTGPKAPAEGAESKPSPSTRSPYLLIAMVDFLDDCVAERLYGVGGANQRDMVAKMEELLGELVSVDPIRRDYWNYLKKSKVDKRKTG